MITGSIRIAVLAGWVAGLLWWERRTSLRSFVDCKVKRDVRNLAVALPALTVVQLFEVPVAVAIARRAQQQRSGLLMIAQVPEWVRSAAAILLLDYTLYIWHRLTHRVSFLWRFHQVHHVDREMDASTALRFHFGEITLSVAFRAAQVWLIGPTPAAYGAWQTFVFLCILFHHANIRLPLAVERRLARVLVTPRLHGIHHSVAPEDVNSNWSSGLTVWDCLHGTLRTRVPQDSITIGVQGLRDDRHQELCSNLSLPFHDGIGVIPTAGASHCEPVSALEA
ncbi:MAG: fatty acid hydroxylase superfamily protein [Bryobacterales bacterium]|nr:fatty acid hydroxylase superfamily protein [Bryobacterales bacterium]